MTQQPGDGAGQSAGRRRSQQAAEDGAQHPARHEHHHQQQRQHVACIAAALPLLVGRRQRFAVDHADHLVDAGFDAGVEVARFEARRDVLIDDAVRDRIRQSALQAPSHFDAHAPVVLRHQQDGAVIDVFSSGPPRLGNANAVLFDCLRLGGGHDEYGDLTTLLALQVGQFGLDARHRTAGQSTGQVDDGR